MAAETTALQANEVMTWYESKFLERAKIRLVHREGLQKKTHQKSSGDVIQWDRYTPLTAATTALTEGTNPGEVSIASATVSAALEEYGVTVKVAKRLSLVSIDKNDGEKVGLVGQNMGETLDTLARDELYTGATAQITGHTLLSDIAATDTFSEKAVRKAVRTLDVNKAPTYADGYYIGKIGAFTKYDLMGDSVWQAAKTYQDTKDLYQGEIGELDGVRFLVSNNQKTESSTVTVYSNFIHGEFAVGEMDLEGDMPRLFIKTPGPNSTDNSADRFSTIAWAGSYAAKTLISTWLLNVKTGATA